MARAKQLETDLKTIDLKKNAKNSRHPAKNGQNARNSQRSANQSGQVSVNQNGRNSQNSAKSSKKEHSEAAFQGMLVVPHEKNISRERTPTILEVETARESAKIAPKTTSETGLEPTLIQNRPLPATANLVVETSGTTRAFSTANTFSVAATPDITDTFSTANTLDTSDTHDATNTPIETPSFVEEPDPDEVLFEIPENALTNFELIAKRQAESKGTAIKNSEIGFVRDGVTSTKSGETVPVNDSATPISDEASAAYAKTIADYFAAENAPKPAPKPTRKLGPRRRKLTIFSKPKRHYSNRLSYDDLVNLEAKVGRLVFGPVPAGHHREFFEHRKNVWFWHESFVDAAGAVQDTTVFYEVRPTGVFKKLLGGANYEKLEGDELTNFREAASQYLNLIRTRVYNEI